MRRTLATIEYDSDSAAEAAGAALAHAAADWLKTRRALLRSLGYYCSMPHLVENTGDETSARWEVVDVYTGTLLAACWVAFPHEGQVAQLLADDFGVPAGGSPS